MTRVKAKAAAPPQPAHKLPFFDREVSNWSGFHQAVDRFLDGRHIFRGDCDVRHQLVPSVGRNSETWTYSPDLERELLEEFKREAIPYLVRSTVDMDDWAWLALAQHHGVPTRLLDWSESPFVALFFAVWGPWESEGRDAAVYVIEEPKAVTQFTDSPFDISQTSFFYPRHITSRITSQSGLFTIQKEPLAPFDGKVTQLIIKAAAKPDIRRKLAAVGIHDASIFADLDGLCRRLKIQRQHSPFVGAGTLRSRSRRLPRDPNDPQKGRWGRLAERNGWKLSATVSKSEGSDNWFRINLTVRSTKDRLLEKAVRFHLHHTFPQSVRRAPPKSDKTVIKDKLPEPVRSLHLSLWSYGAFTVGAEILQDRTTLELDLSTLPRAPKRFRER